ncbi:ABC transporter ATP-binding protein [Aggregicoccus sp. 17bor-14]|uniref:ABC transporter ATP-binding protein n=1 Tax=Myxococcaceae TaxID=31 RepID=UPI00129C7EC7|nr:MULTISPECIES: ABC transporter ATP-binding protein [Myxococcaceae]MBF5042350.1 ABC transporter ATP-binding protein [Simulacricoccus sp. 17bor-14]MRI88123.1 ABC transporter ATP-binding protein [Aggregicoccus sp. 17bor-14]
MNPALETAGAPLFELENVTRTYKVGDTLVHALRGVSLKVARGEFVAIMGTSGSGKTTLMNVLGCLDKPSTGTYRLAGTDVNKLSRDELAELRNRTLGFVFQNFNLLSRTSAEDNVELPLVYAGVPRKERKARSRAALERVGLGHRMDHHPTQLSGGQQQRVAIARALVGEPKVILADEPTGNLDSRTGIEVMALLQQLSASGITIVLVTHEPDVAAYAQRVVVVRDGKVRADRRQEPLVAVVPPLEVEPDDAPQEAAS